MNEGAVCDAHPTGLAACRPRWRSESGLFVTEVKPKVILFDESMKPPFYRYILARTAGISAGVGVVGALALMLMSIHSEGVLIFRIGVLTWIVLVAVPVAAIGWMVGTIFLWGMVLGPVAARLQGWPFAVGDRVWILSGAHKNTITTVHEVWVERGQVRVELGPELKRKVEDVYCAVAVCRAHIAEPADLPPRDSVRHQIDPREANDI